MGDLEGALITDGPCRFLPSLHRPSSNCNVSFFSSGLDPLWRLHIGCRRIHHGHTSSCHQSVAIETATVVETLTGDHRTPASLHSCSATWWLRSTDMSTTPGPTALHRIGGSAALVVLYVRCVRIQVKLHALHYYSSRRSVIRATSDADQAHPSDRGRLHAFAPRSRVHQCHLSTSSLTSLPRSFQPSFLIQSRLDHTVSGPVLSASKLVVNFLLSFCLLRIPTQERGIA